MRTFLRILFILGVLLCFQNCGSPSGQQPDPFSSKGNGDPYSGIEKNAGSYFVFAEEVLCEGVLQADKNYRYRIDIPETGESASFTDSCSGEARSIAISEIDFSDYQSETLIYSDLAFQKAEGATEPQVAQEVLYAKCFSQASDRTSESFEYLVRKLRGQDSYNIARYSSTGHQRLFEGAQLSQSGAILSFDHPQVQLQIDNIADQTRLPGQVTYSLGSETLTCLLQEKSALSLSASLAQ